MTTLDLLRTHPFLVGLPEPWLARLAAHARPVVRHPGTRLFRADRPAERFWLLRDGQVGLDFPVPHRGDVQIDLIGPGQVLGWSWLRPPYRWQFGAVATDRTVAIEFDAAAVRRLITADDAFGRQFTERFMGVALERLQATRIRLLDLYAYPVHASGVDPVR
ncbi:cyclic nucleotide-binding domain-containing protein [Micromonospora echinofusca]|uniref:Cyclic nucleotide-binding domain-containing protein n=1 Tax=Micromonospora echinofusca TaxID=47858 RepID=A0ABS3VW86_MICEH|nr:cyclic nucleotide-binding domain-containing protein [Micromonospora echinofusca]MBO4208770.1 cyclic nucleotide-binding domain-containing protein [Micromonospora echinofusca]